MKMYLDFEHSTNKIIAEEYIPYIAKYKEIIIFGAGETGIYLLSILKQYGLGPVCFCDNYKGKQGTEKNGLMIYSPTEAVKRYPKACICIGSLWAEEIKQQIHLAFPAFKDKIFVIFSPMVWELKEKKLFSSEVSFIQSNLKEFNNIYNQFYDEKSKKIFENIINFRLTRKRQYLEDSFCIGEQYFDTEIINPVLFSQKGYCIDGGSFDGDTVERFYELYPDSDFIFQCYEPDEKNINNFMKRTALIQYHKVFIHKAGLYDKTSKTGSVSGNSMGAAIDIESSGNISLETINELPDDLQIKFIKLDIEGAELKALYGGYERIVKDRPVMAICAYHLQDDLIKLPNFINRLPDYKIFLRHYMIASSETILYGIPAEKQ